MIFVCEHCSEGTREKRLVEIGKNLSDLEHAKWQAVAYELQGEDQFQYLRAYSPGEHPLFYAAWS